MGRDIWAKWVSSFFCLLLIACRFFCLHLFLRQPPFSLARASSLLSLSWTSCFASLFAPFPIRQVEVVGGVRRSLKQWRGESTQWSHQVCCFSRTQPVRFPTCHAPMLSLHQLSDGEIRTRDP